MHRMFWLAAGIVAGGGAVLGSLNYHVLRTEKGLEFIPKQAATLDETYLDVRQFGIGDWGDHDVVARAILQAKRDDLLQDSAANSLHQGMNQLWDNVRK